MVAAAFTETVLFKGKGNGRPIHVSATVSDVVNEFAIFPDGNGFIQLPSDQDYWLVDVITVTGGTDTNFQEIYANSMDTGIKLSNKANLNTSNFRALATLPLSFKAGSLIRLKQLTT